LKLIIYLANNSFLSIITTFHVSISVKVAATGVETSVTRLQAFAAALLMEAGQVSETFDLCPKFTKGSKMLNGTNRSGIAGKQKQLKVTNTKLEATLNNKDRTCMKRKEEKFVYEIKSRDINNIR
jgi:hypothetical protein